MARNEINVDLTVTDHASEGARLAKQIIDELDEPVDIPFTADADDAVDELEKVEKAAKKTDDSVKKMGDSSDQSRSVLANMIGNSVQDLGALGGVAGTAGMALGQIGEYATEGNIALKSMAATAIPLLAVTVAVQGIAKNAARVKEARAFEEDQVRGWADAMIDGATAVDAMTESFIEAGKAEVSIGGHVLDISELLLEAGFNAETFSTMVEGGEGAIGRWAAAARAAGADTNQVAVIVAAARQEVDNLSESEAIAATTAEFTAAKQGDLAAALAEVDVGATDAELAMSNYHAALDQSATYLAAVADADALAGSLEEVARLAREGKTDTEEYRDAQRGLAQDNNALAQTVVGLVEQYGTIPDEERTRILAELPTAKQAEFSAWMDTVEAGATVPVSVVPDYQSINRTKNAINSSLGGWGGFGWTAGPAAAGTSVNVTVNAPAGMRADDVIAAATKYARRNGGTVLQRGGRVRPGRPR